MARKVALLAESVDWNYDGVYQIITDSESLSSRRAWIEIIFRIEPLTFSQVSLSSRRAWIEIKSEKRLKIVRFGRSPRGERGLKFVLSRVYKNGYYLSLSSRRAWIEICACLHQRNDENVALLAESVDWNSPAAFAFIRRSSRSPRGERGLKFLYL